MKRKRRERPEHGKSKRRLWVEAGGSERNLHHKKINRFSPKYTRVIHNF